ncbi:peptidase [Methylobacterium sp. Leaf399]|uniref:A24 family peptidase n=1 Tax=Methylobacterium sp. Leaf399 TaxID=1736364 RepID=UPI0006F9E357|nr:prepilin peptidase [Methylobacterium sp. Leaf399]KQT19509.1 peptidase [Methylobacterium sp. Leaf399]
MGTLGLLVVFPFLMAYAASSDLLTMTIPNRVSLILVVGFFAFAAACGFTWTEVGLHVGAGSLVLAVTFTLFALGVIGGGDAKLAAATALWLGFDHLVDYLIVASIAGGALTLLLLVSRNYPLPFIAGRLPFVLHLHDRKTGVPYGIALAASALVVLPETLVWSRALAA